MDAKNNNFPVQAEYTDRGGGAASVSGPSPALSIAEIIGTLRRGRRYLIFGSLLGFALAVCYTAFVPNLYRSSARILLDRSVTRYFNKIADDPTFDEADIANQLYVLSSESIAIPVVRSMYLAHDSEFVGSTKTGGGSFNSLKKFVKQFVDWNRSADPLIDPDAALEETAVENFLMRLSVYREDANVINVTFASEDPNKAASIANAIADTYISTSLETKLASTKMVSQWLQDRLIDLRLQATNADRALQDYRIANNLVNAGKGSLNSDQLDNLITQLTNARIAVTEAKTRLDSLDKITGQGITGTSATDAMTKLRAEYRDLAAKASELGVPPTHPAAVRMQKKMDEVRLSIQEEEQRVIGSYAKEYQVAKARESELAATAAQLQQQVGANNQALVKMRELESSADTLRSIYNTFLQKFGEINTIQTEAIPVQNARVLTRAVPVGKSSKKVAAVFGGGILFGLFLGAGAAVAREWAADVFRTPKAVEEVAGGRCVILPRVKPNGLIGIATESALIEEFVVDAPFSRFAETLRELKALINIAQLVDRGVKVIGVVSSVPNEGKTTVAANLAALMVASSRARTLIIDSDVHLRRLTARLAPDAHEGLIEALADPWNLVGFVHHRPNSGLDVLPCPLRSRLPNAAELLGSPQMGQLLVAAREAYDYVVIEVAPIMSVVDIKMIERFIDAFIFVVEWGQTKRSVVLEALSEAHIIRERLLGIVLNKVDESALRRIEAYKGDRFKVYYEE